MLQTLCTECGLLLPTNANFCSGCGSTASGAKKVEPSAASALAVGSTVSPAVIVPVEQAVSVEKLEQSGINQASVIAFLAHRVVFVFIYLLIVAPTYVLPYFGSNSAFVNVLGASLNVGALPQFWIHVTLLYLAFIVTWFRGIYIGKSWITIFPFLAALFDMVPGFNWIFLIPTILHVITLVVAVQGEPVNAQVSSWHLRGAAGVCLLLLLAVAVQYNNYDAAMYSNRNTAKPGISPDTSAPKSTGITSTEKMKTTDVSLPTGWRLGLGAVNREAGGSERIISRSALIDEEGTALSYTTQYFWHGYFKYRNLGLKALGSTVLYAAPPENNDVSKLSIEANESFSIFDQYSIISKPAVLIATQNTSLQVSGAVDPYPISKGQKLVIVEGTQGECPTFYVSGAGYHDLCFTPGENQLFNEGKAHTRTSFRIKSVSGVEGWTRFYEYGDLGELEQQINRDWIN